MKFPLFRFFLYGVIDEAGLFNKSSVFVLIILKKRMPWSLVTRSKRFIRRIDSDPIHLRLDDTIGNDSGAT